MIVKNQSSELETIRLLRVCFSAQTKVNMNNKLAPTTRPRNRMLSIVTRLLLK